jgi:hypothetical protein
MIIRFSQGWAQFHAHAEQCNNWQLGSNLQRKPVGSKPCPPYICSNGVVAHLHDISKKLTGNF